MKIVRQTTIADCDIVLYRVSSDPIKLHLTDGLDFSKNYNNVVEAMQAYSKLVKNVSHDASMLERANIESLADPYGYDDTPAIHVKRKTKRVKIKDKRLKPHQRRKVWAKVTASSVKSKVSENIDAGRVSHNAKFIDPIRYSYQKGRKLGDKGRDTLA